MHKIYLKPDKENSLRRFRPRTSSGVIVRFDDKPGEGEIVEMYTSEKESIAKGHFQIGSIAMRVLPSKQEGIDRNLWERRLEVTYDTRRNIGIATSPTNSTYRLAHGKGDNLSGLVIDVYTRIAVIQAHFAGMCVDRVVAAEILPEMMNNQIENIYYKSGTTSSFKMDLFPKSGSLKGGSNGNIAQEYGLKFHVDRLKGQKTGLLVDQHKNRVLLECYAKDHLALNMSYYTGRSPFYIMRRGVKQVHSIDSSAGAIDLINKSVELDFPGDTCYATLTENAFRYLDHMGDQYDLIALDPPTFVKHKDASHNAPQGYRKLNAKIFEKVKPGGILSTLSCSQVVAKDNFRTIIFAATAISGRSVCILHQLTRPAGHPINIYHPRGECLKGLVLYVE